MASVYHLGVLSHYPLMYIIYLNQSLILDAESIYLPLPSRPFGLTPLILHQTTLYTIYPSLKIEQRKGRKGREESHGWKKIDSMVINRRILKDFISTPALTNLLVTGQERTNFPTHHKVLLSKLNFCSIISKTAYIVLRKL